MPNGMFNLVEMAKVPGSKFDLGHKHLSSFDIGDLVPTLQVEVLPGDSFDINIECMTRMAPMIAPCYTNIKIDHHVFFVPNRVLWPGWEDWITGKTAVEHPYCIPQSITELELGNYLGYRNQDNLKQNALFAAAYFKIYDDYYRAEHIETTEKFTELTAGNNTYLVDTLHMNEECLKRAWAHDYFTSALPSPQVGSAVELPLLSNDNVDVTAKAYNAFANPPYFKKKADGTIAATAESIDKAVTAGWLTSATDGNLYLDPNGSLEVDISSDVVDINTLREAFALQRWLEKEMRAGQRYVEWNMSMFGVASSDARLQRAEYVGGARQNMIISEVLSTADAGAYDVGEIKGHGISAGAGKRFKFTAEEHGILMCITSAIPEAYYYQGAHKSLQKVDRYDYANPMFARLGEQPIAQSELYFAETDTQATLDTVFGYISRYAEYKSLPNRISGEFLNTLEFWHMGRKFTSAPTLNTSFIQCSTDKRQFSAVAGSNTILAMLNFNIWAYRKLPKYGVPSIVG